MRPEEQDNRIDYIELPVTDMDRAKTFYGAVFGWSFTDYGPEYASFHDGRTDGGFALTSAVRPGGPLVVAFAVDLEAAVERVTKNGGEVVRPIFEFPGGRRFQFHDPEGNELAVWSDR